VTDDPAQTFEIGLANPCRYSEVRLGRLRPWLVEIARAVATDHDGVGIRFVSDLEMRRISCGYRQLDAATDVLSFPGDESPEGRYLGDVVVAVPTARRQADRAGHSCERELKLLILHGLLHCLGYDHEKDNGEMARVEHRLRRRWVADE